MSWRQLLSFSLLALVAGASAYGLSIAANDRGTGERKQAVSLKDVPDPVKATILAEVLHELFELEIEEIQREDANGESMFEVEFELDGVDIELEIAANGEVLEKEVEREGHHDDDDDDGDDEDDDDDDD